MAKNIVFCADGTWNSPRADENDDHQADPTNVYKLFLWLSGEFSSESLRAADEQEKYLNDNGATVQVAKYLHGVGDARNVIHKIMGGSFGAGVISRIVRGYTFISRHYQPGDHIYITGFSRGAYTARALAGLIASQGVLAPHLTKDKERAYRYGAQVWYRYRKNNQEQSTRWSKIAEALSDLPAFLQQDKLQANDLIAVDRIAAVAVWDTVGAMGLPQFEHGERVDAYAFADLSLPGKIARGIHAVSLDEQRVDFTPCLWRDDPRVEQWLFPGAHADVGGGYPTNDNQSGLSDLALMWVKDQLQDLGVQFLNTPPIAINPDPAGVAHQPWRKAPWTLPGVRLSAREFAATMREHESISQRIAAGVVHADPEKNAEPYWPSNRPSRE
jgi:uncharacterized protein (DUF2235 family)